MARRDELLAFGIAPGAISAAVRAGDAFRIRRAWYGVPETTFEQRVAVAVGGRLGGLSAARSYGLWTGTPGDVHVSWNPHGNVAVAGRRSEYAEHHLVAGARIVPHWRISAEPPHDLWRETLEVSLLQVLDAAERPIAMAVLDSAIHEGLMTRDEVLALVADRRAIAQLSAIIDGLPDSGLESIVRLWLHVNGIPERLHPWVLGMELDLLVGRSLAIETDGSLFHAGPEAFERDRVRDAILASAGYITVRFSYRQIMGDWPGCERRLREHLARGDHLRPVSA